MDLRLIAPQAEQRAVPDCELIDRLPPAIFGHDSARATADAALAVAMCGNVVEQAP